MDEHSHDFPISPTNIAGMLSRVVARALRESGYMRAEEYVSHWPEILGGKIGQAIRKIQGKYAKGDEVTTEDTKELVKALEESPKEAATLLGLLTADLVKDTVDAKSERKAVLDAFKTIFGIICAYVRTATTSVALAGFVHEQDCISYWHLTGKAPDFSNINDTYLFPSGLEVYIRYEQPTRTLVQIRCKPVEARFNRSNVDHPIRPSSSPYRIRSSPTRPDPARSPHAKMGRCIPPCQSPIRLFRLRP